MQNSGKTKDWRVGEATESISFTQFTRNQSKSQLDFRGYKVMPISTWTLEINHEHHLKRRRKTHTCILEFSTNIMVVQVELSSDSINKVSGSSFVDGKTWLGGDTSLKIDSQVLQRRLVIGKIDRYFTLITSQKNILEFSKWMY